MSLIQDQVRERLERYTSEISQDIELMWEEDENEGSLVLPILIEAVLINLNALIKSVPEDLQGRYVQRVHEVIQQTPKGN